MHKGKQIVSSFAVAVLAMPLAAGAEIVTQWNFNSPVPDNNIATGTTSPSIGTGIATLVGGVTSPEFGGGNNNGGSTDPTVDDDSAWQTTTYPAQGTGNLTAGTQYAVSTAGFEDIVVTYDLRHSNTSSRFEQFQYSLDGTSFVSFGAPFSGPSGDTWFNLRTADLSSIAGANDNPDFAFRIVAAFDPATGTSYAASNTGGNYAASGTWRFDMVTVNGSAIPEPASLALIALPGLALLARRRRNG